MYILTEERFIIDMNYSINIETLRLFLNIVEPCIVEHGYVKSGHAKVKNLKSVGTVGDLQL